MTQYELERDLLARGIEDTEGTIHANDAKCSAALVTHGLLFAGLVAISANAADLYPEGNPVLRLLALCLAGLTIIAFTISICALLRAVMPYRSERMVDAIKKRNPPGVFFPPRVKRGQERKAITRQLDAVKKLTYKSAKDELVYESIKLAVIRDHEKRWAQLGYRALFAEILVAVAYLSLVAVIALDTV